jgi:hypothetical protein
LKCLAKAKPYHHVATASFLPTPVATGFVERTFSCRGRWRRLRLDYEHSDDSSASIIKIASIVCMLRRLAPSPTQVELNSIFADQFAFPDSFLESTECHSSVAPMRKRASAHPEIIADTN